VLRAQEGMNLCIFFPLCIGEGLQISIFFGAEFQQLISFYPYIYVYTKCEIFPLLKKQNHQKFKISKKSSCFTTLFKQGAMIYRRILNEKFIFIAGQ
jgi:hypothetical protein